MKKVKYTLATLMVALVVAVVCVGCKKDEGTNMSQSPNNFENEKSVAVNTLVQEIAKASINDDFRNLVYKSISFRFDGDDDVLCKELQKKNREMNGEELNILEALDYFQIQGRYPQIYIPFFEENRDIRGTENVIVVNAIDINESDQAFQGYFWNGEALVPTDCLIDEEYAENHEVWVISINERVDENGNPLTVFRNGDDDVSKESKSARSGTKNEYVMTINCTNLSEIESWIYGAPEIRCDCVSGNSAKISSQFFYPDRRRDVDNRDWVVDCCGGRRMYYWNTTQHTKYVYFQWTEIDNSGSSISFPITFKVGVVSVGTTITLKADDRDAGGYLVYFDDNLVGHPYNTGLIKWVDDYALDD